MFRSAAGAHIQPVNAKAEIQGSLRKADDVAAIRGTFQAMQENDLALSGAVGGLVFVGDYGDLGSHGIFYPRRRKANLVDLAMPVISSNSS